MSGYNHRWAEEGQAVPLVMTDIRAPVTRAVTRAREQAILGSDRSVYSNIGHQIITLTSHSSLGRVCLETQLYADIRVILMKAFKKYFFIVFSS